MDWLLRRLLALWVRYTVRPEDAAARLHGRSNPGLLRARAPQHHGSGGAAERLRAPEARAAAEAAAAAVAGAALLLLSQPAARLLGRAHRPPPASRWCSMIAALRAHPELDVDLVPAAVYWGRAPQKEGSWLRLLFAENWALTTRARKFFAGAHQRPQRVRGVRRADLAALAARRDAPAHDQARRVTRVLRGILRRQRAVRIGPDLSHRRTIVARVLRARAVRAVVARRCARRNITRRQALLQARKYAFEIAANYSHAFVQFTEKLLGRVWNRVYDGVKFNHAATLKEVSEGQRSGLRALPSQPHGLPAAVVHHLSPGLRAAAHRRGHQSQHPGGRPLPAQGRRVFHPPQLSRQRAVHRGVHEIPRGHHGARPLHRILHRGRPLAHRPAAAAEDRHVVDDGAQLPARSGAPGGVRAGVLRLRAHRRGQHLHLASCRARPRRRRAGSDLLLLACACCASGSARCT